MSVLPPPRLITRARLAAAPFILIFLAAPPALAHTSERAFILLLPTGYYLVGGALAVTASFLILLALPADGIRQCFEARLELMRLPTALQSWLSALSFVALALLVIVGYLGSRDPLDNPLPLMVWTIWWIGVTLAHALFGNLWRWINPWVAPYRLIRRLLGWEGAPFPYRLGYWPAVVSFLAFAWFELIHPAPDDPAVLALAVIVYSAVTWIGMALFGEETWLARGEAFSVFFGLIGRMAPFQSEPASQPSRRVYLVVPGRALAGIEPLPPSGILFVLLTLATVSFDGLSRTFWWLGLNGINPLEFPGRSAVVGINSVGLLALFIALATAFLACIAMGRALSGRHGPFWPTAGALAASILPISVGYQFAHYLTAFLVNAQYAAIAATDPLGRGWLDAEERMHGVTTSFLANQADVSVIWNLQAAGIVLGHILAVLVAHLITLRRETDRRAVLAGQAPLAVLMIGYTLFGLWLLSAPAAG